MTDVLLDLLEKEDIAESSFIGDLLNEFVMYIYFLKNYSDVCLPMQFIEADRALIPHITWTCKFDTNGICNRKLFYPKNFKKRFNDCKEDPNIRFIISFIYLEFCNSRQGQYCSHSNAFIYDKRDNSIEIFEPFGLSTPGPWFDKEQFVAKITDFFKGMEINEVYYDYCPNISFQQIQALEKELEGLETDPGEGFCIAWSIWWINYRLKNADSDLDRGELITKALEYLKRSPRTFTKFIRNYTGFITKEKNNIIAQVYDTLNMAEEGRMLINKLTEQAVEQNRLQNLLRKAQKQKDADSINAIKKKLKISYTPEESKLLQQFAEILENMNFQKSVFDPNKISIIQD
jgi:hypothetical protein